jgi:hypothetical protein
MELVVVRVVIPARAQCLAIAAVSMATGMSFPHYLSLQKLTDTI